MNALRFVCVVALCFAVAVSAAGGYPTCPAAANKLFANVTCPAAAACAAERCTCFGGTNSNGVCNGATTTASCDQTHRCVTSFIKCLIDSANMLTNTSTCFRNLAPLHDSMVLLVSGAQQWNASAAYLACNNEACLIYNRSSSGVCNSTNNYQSLCARSPVSFTGQFTLSGNFSKIFANATALAALRACLALDLTNHLRFPTTIVAVTKNPDDTVTVVFNVGAPKSVVDSELTTAEGNTNWMKCLNAAKFAELGGTGTLGGPTFSDTPTPQPGTTPSPTTPAPSSASLMWSAASIISAVVALLVIA